MPIVAAGIPIYFVGAAAFTSLAAAYAYINREGLSESISDAYNYYTGNDELTTLEDLGIKVDNTSKEYKTYEYAFPSNSSTDKDLTLTQIKDIKSFPNMSQSGYTGTNFVGENQQVIRLDEKVVNSPTIKPQIDELIKLENNKTKMVEKGVFSKLDQKTQSFYEDQIRAKETNIANALKQNTVVMEEKQTNGLANLGNRIAYSATTGGVMGMADGGDVENFPRRTGEISGPGTKTSDSIPAMLSDGEFVQRADAVNGAGVMMGAKNAQEAREKGADFMYALQSKLAKMGKKVG